MVSFDYQQLPESYNPGIMDWLIIEIQWSNEEVRNRECSNVIIVSYCGVKQLPALLSSHPSPFIPHTCGHTYIMSEQQTDKNWSVI